MKYIRTLLLFFAVGLLSQAFGQQNYLSVQYSASYPMLSLSDFTGNISPRGVHVEYEYLLTEKVSLGFDAGWLVFNEEGGYRTIQDGTEALSGYEFRYTNQFPILVAAGYRFNPDKTLVPFAEMGIGSTFNQRDLNIGTFQITQSNWLFTVNPEIGFYYKLSEGVNAKASLQYLQQFSGEGIGNQGVLSAGVGINFIFLEGD